MRGRYGAGRAFISARHADGGLVRHDPVNEGAEVADQALVYAALWNLGCPIWVHQLAGQHHAAVRAWRSPEGVHVEADQRVVGTEGRAGGDADDERVFVSRDDQLGLAGQDCVAATEQERVVGRNFVVAFGPLGFLLVQQGGVVRIGVLVWTGRKRYLVLVMDLKPDGPLTVVFAGQERR